MEEDTRKQEIADLFKAGVLTADNFLQLVTFQYSVTEDEAVILYAEWLLEGDAKSNSLEKRLERAVEAYNDAVEEETWESYAAIVNAAEFTSQAAVGDFSGLQAFNGDLKSIKRTNKRLARLRGKIFAIQDKLEDREAEMYSRARRDLLSE